MQVEPAKSLLKQWLKLAVRLEEELEQGEPNDAELQALLEERARVQQQLQGFLHKAGEGGGAAESLRHSLFEDPEIREWIEEILASDRRSIQRAATLRAAAAEKLAEVRQRRELASSYRRAAGSSSFVEATFFDRTV